MPAHRKSCTGLGNARIHGVVPGSTEHKILLALRAPGGLTAEQITARFGHVSASLWRLSRAGLVNLPPTGKKGIATRLTEHARSLTDHHGPLSRAANLINYCQL